MAVDRTLAGRYKRNRLMALSDHAHRIQQHREVLSSYIVNRNIDMKEWHTSEIAPLSVEEIAAATDLPLDIVKNILAQDWHQAGMK